jgi:hypothetical protein
MHHIAVPESVAPTIRLIAWSRAPDAEPIALALATVDDEHQRTLADAFHPAPGAATPACRTPAVVVVDEPELLWQEDVARLHAPNAVVLGAGEDVERSLAMLVAGAAALLPADASTATVVDAVGCVLRGEAVVPPDVAVALAQRVQAAESLG